MNLLGISAQQDSGGISAPVSINDFIVTYSFSASSTPLFRELVISVGFSSDTF